MSGASSFFRLLQKYANRATGAEPPKETVIGYVEGWRWWKLDIMVEPVYPTLNASVVSALHAEMRTDCMHPLHRPVCHLMSNNVPFEWQWEGENVVKRLSPSLHIADEPVDLWSNSGFYSYKRPYIENHNNELFGRIACYGDVVECEYGYRAEKARVLDVWCRPENWEQLCHIPQIKGTFTIEPGKFGEYTCLTLETHKESLDTSLSSSLTTTLLLDQQNRKQSLSQMFSPWMSPPIQSPFHSYLLVEPKQIIHRTYPVCELCGEGIRPDEPVVELFEFPEGDLCGSVLNKTFEWVKKKQHLECAAKEQRGELFPPGLSPSWSTPTTSASGSAWASNTPSHGVTMAHLNALINQLWWKA